MRSKNVGIEEARKRLGDLVTAAQQGTDIILTRNGKPAARIVRIQEDTVPAYTVEIQASNAAGDMWQALAPAETVTDPIAESIEELAQDVAVNQTIAEGDNWRVCIWQGADADTGTQPDYILDGESPERANSMGVTADEG